MRCSLSLSVLVIIYAAFVDSFKCFHTADIISALVRTSIWLCHVIVRYNLFCFIIYLAKHRNCYFQPNNFGYRTFGASLLVCLQAFVLHAYCNHVLYLLYRRSSVMLRRQEETTHPLSQSSRSMLRWPSSSRTKRTFFQNLDSSCQTLTIQL